MSAPFHICLSPWKSSLVRLSAAEAQPSLKILRECRVILMSCHSSDNINLCKLTGNYWFDFLYSNLTACSKIFYVHVSTDTLRLMPFWSWTNSQYPFFTFCTQWVFPRCLAKFKSIVIIRTHIFWTFLSKSFPWFKAWLGIGVNDVIYSKCHTGWKYNNN